MTKAEAIEKVLIDNGGTANWDIIYNNIEKYYPGAKDSKEWEAGLRGVLYRDIRNHKRFKRIGLSIFALLEYQEEKKPEKTDKTRMHSYIEGICIELGNFNNYLTYTADPSASYRDNLKLNNFVSLHELPIFSYNGIIDEVKRIDVIWFNKNGFAFPKKTFEVVDSISTLDGAFKRSIQLQNFNTKFFIVAPEKHHNKFLQTLDLEVYRSQKKRFYFINYDDIQDLYETTAKKNKLESKLLL